MYIAYFGLAEKPFSLTPDPRFLYLSERHAEALAHLQYGILEGGGFIQLTGEVGTGKTTLTRTLLARLPDEIELALVINSRLAERELLLTVCEELRVAGCADAPDVKTLIDRLNARLLEIHGSGKRAVLMIDEAQNLGIEVLEQLRLLTNLETSTAKLLQIILVGQPELRDTLARNDLRQLAQRVTGRYHLGPLDPEDTAAYVRHRLAVAGATRELFTPGALRAVHARSGGVPRLINVICDRALLGAYTAERPRVTRRLVGAAAKEVGGRPPRRLWSTHALAGASAASVALVVAVAGWRLAFTDDAKLPAPPQPAASAGVAATLEAPPDAGVAAAPEAAPAAHGQAGGDEPVASARVGVLLQSAADTGTDGAFATLLGLWDVERAPPDVQPCRHVETHGLRCQHQLGSWTLLRALNRPAILALIDEKGEPHQIVLSALDERRATLHVDGVPHVVTADDLASYWFGEFLILWRPHPEASQLMLPGAKSDGVRWLRETLAGLQGGGDTSPDPAYYDDVLTERVRVFQRHHGLKADGKAGLQTLIALDTVAGDPQAPTLAERG
jgi:general secretion pathway protein A